MTKAVELYVESCEDEGVVSNESICQRALEIYACPTPAEAVSLMTTEEEDRLGQADRPLLAAENDLLETMDFNLRTAAVYEAADGTVIQEGSDTLRLQTNGRLSFHGAESGQARYQALSAREKDLQIKAEEILEAVTTDWRGEAGLRCQSIRTLEDGQVELTFCYLLNGTPVQLWDEGWAARFVFSGSDLMSFTICLRRYTGTDQTLQALPERQAAAAASALGQAGKELQLCYLDTGTGEMVTADWTVREGT